MAISSSAQAPLTPSFYQAARYWLRLGCISFGGPAGQIAIMHQELVVQRRWISERRFLHALNYCMLLPGPEAQQLATYIGWLLYGKSGGIVAGTLFILPGFFLLIGLAWIYMGYGTMPMLAGLLYGIKPAVIALILFAAYRMGRSVLHRVALWLIAILAFLALACLHLPIPAIVISAAVIGVLGHRYAPGSFMGIQPDSVAPAQVSALIDDDSPIPAHAMLNWRSLWHVTLSSLAIWCVGALLLAACYGWHGIYTQMAWLFTKAALFSFGGAYAVLPYIYQGAVLDHHWLSAAQMMDALALGETTPGPLVMVVTFVGFVGGWNQSGVDQAQGAALLAATLVTVSTFMPSFLFILIGGPFIEHTYGRTGLTAPLSAVTAAVVGIILNLALLLASQVLLLPGPAPVPDWPGLLLCSMAALALFSRRVGVIAVILACALCGLAWHSVQ